MSATPLDHETRKKVYDHIKSNPGTSFIRIKNTFGLAEGTLRYHLKYLENFHEIRSCLENNIRCYYPNQSMIFDHALDEDLEILKLNHTQTLLLETIQRYPGLTQKDLMYKTGLSRITIIYNLSSLLDFGVVRKESSGKFIKYYYISNSELRRKILEVIIHKFINNHIDEKSFLAMNDKLGE